MARKPAHRGANATWPILLILMVGALAACTGPTPPATAAPTATTLPTQTPRPTATPRPTDTPQPTATATPVPPLTLKALHNAVYPSDWTKEKTVQLVDGYYREKYTPDSATELVISLADMMTFGDLDGDGVEDVAVIVVGRPGGTGTFYNLVAVLNGGGEPVAVSHTFLGDRVILRSMSVRSGRVTVEMVSHSFEAPMCCPDQETRQVYVLQDSGLTLVEQVDTPLEKPLLPSTSAPVRIGLGPGQTSASIQGSILPIGYKTYVISAQTGQTLGVSVSSSRGHVFLSIRGLDDDAVLLTIRDESSEWSGDVPTSQDYEISLASIAGSETSYTLQVSLTGEPAATPEPKPTPAPPGSVVYLTFDDGPIPKWTPHILDALAPFDAQGTFFVLGQLAEQYPEVLEDEIAVGSTIGNHTFDHRTLDGIGREAFFKEIQDTEAALGGLGTKCIRPPFGAMDGYTRAWAAELGYKIVLWNVDSEDWRQPGADVIASNVLDHIRPGAIILFHDGGGDRSQTAEALGTILEKLQRLGYRFELACQ